MRFYWNPIARIIIIIINVEQLGGGMSRSKIKLTQDVKYIRRLLMVGKICGVSIVDYGKRSNN